MGSRYGGLKQLDPITDHGEFIIDFSIFDAIREGFDRLVFIIQKDNLELFRETVGARIEKNIKVEYCFQSFDDIPAGTAVPQGRTKPLGTGHALFCARHLLHENFGIINADDFYGREAFHLLAEHLRTAQAGECCMAGYRLANTLSENGSVSRGECRVSQDGRLLSISERVSISREGDHAVYNEEGKNIVLPLDTVVSMNCWGLTPDILPKMEKDFADFMKELPASENPMKKEYYLPLTMENLMKQGDVTVDVYPTDAVWYGVTYKEDKTGVKAGLKALIASGIYPDGLWKN